MRKIITAIALLCCVCAQAQTPQQLRDSLSKVSQRLSFKPDSIDLRLKKASLNVQLEQWDYALDEYGKFTSGPDQNTDYYALTISGVNVSNHGFSSFGEQKVDTDLYPAYDSRNQEYAKSAMTELLKTVDNYLVTNNLPHLY
jgi:hypothetical protein